MKAEFHAHDPGEIEFALTVRMSLNDWTALQAQLPHSWPSTGLTRAINSMVSQARAKFWPKEEEAA